MAIFIVFKTTIYAATNYKAKNFNNEADHFKLARI